MHSALLVVMGGKELEVVLEPWGGESDQPVNSAPKQCRLFWIRTHTVSTKNGVTIQLVLECRTVCRKTWVCTQTASLVAANCKTA